MSRYNYQRRKSDVVKIGDITLGGDNDIRLQSMTNTVTTDTQACVEQTLRIVKAGGEIVRLTTQGTREAENMADIKRGLEMRGCSVPLVADVHFNPKAAYVAATTCDKVRINPGNFVDAARTFKQLEFTDEEYNAELQKIRDALIPFLNICKTHNTAVRLGVNHGSLSDRIMSRYGDSPAGMTESVMEYLRICREIDFRDVVISIKASNVVVMTDTVRMLVAAMDAEDMHFPLHLGVTEAGDGEDGRIKSAVGIGALLAEGIGDTIRVSLSEAPENEIPVARRLRDYIAARKNHSPIIEPEIILKGNSRDYAVPIPEIDRLPWPAVIGVDIDLQKTDAWHRVKASSPILSFEDLKPVIIYSDHINRPAEIASWIDRFVAAGNRNPIIIELEYDTDNEEDLQVMAAADAGTLMLNGYGNGLWLKIGGKYLVSGQIDEQKLNDIALGILQASRLRFSKTEYIACPGCGRTLFDLQQTLKDVKAATKEFKGLKIGVMGCIVNGPGEMADADYGYVGAGPGRVSIYRGKELVIKNIPTDEALPRLLKLISSTHQSISQSTENI